MRLVPTAIFFGVVLSAVPAHALLQSDFRSPSQVEELPAWQPNRPEEILLDPPTSQVLDAQATLVPTVQNSTGNPISIVLNETTLEEAIDQLKAETGVDIRIADAALKLKTIDVRIKRKRIDEILEILASQVGGYSEFNSSRSTYFIYSDERKKEPDHEVLEREINEAFPDSFVQLSKIGDQLLVKGQAKDFVEANQILKLIASFMPDSESDKESPSQTNQVIQAAGGFQPGFDSLLGNVNPFSTRDKTSRVINLLTVPGSQQVMLRVTVAEVNRSAARSIGLNFLVRNGEDNLFRSVLGSVPDGGDSFLGDDLSGGTIQALIDSSDVGLAIDALRDLRLAKTLSEPNLTTIHGQRAEFRAGGRFPVPVISGLNNAGTQGVQFVPFGVSLDFVPFILERDRIRLVMRAEVSSRNEEIGSSIGGDDGTSVTGLDTREFSTTVEMKPGQTLAVAGLIQDSLTGNARRIPLLEDIPLVGRATAADSVSSTETELVILVTPQFVHPIANNERPPLPGHQVFEPNDYEFFVNGLLESQYSENFRSAARTDVFRRKAYYDCERSIIAGDSGYSNYCPAASSPVSPVNVIGR